MTEFHLYNKLDPGAKNRDMNQEIRLDRIIETL